MGFQGQKSAGVSMKIYLATWLLEKSQGDTLTKIKKNERLLSYYHTKEKESEFADYCKTGRNQDENLSRRKRSDVTRTKKNSV